MASATDVKAIINSGDGNYDVRLITTVASANNNTGGGTSLSEPYEDWTNSGMILDNPNCYIVSNSGDTNEVDGYVEKSFVVSSVPTTATLTLDGLGDLHISGTVGHVRHTVTLAKSGGDTTTLLDVTDTYSDNEWHTIISGMDLTPYITTTGTYTIRCRGRVSSQWDLPTGYEQCTVYFGNCELNVVWGGYVYTKSIGYWDNISLSVVSSLGTTTTETNRITLIDGAEVFAVSADTQMTALCSTGYLFSWSGESDNGIPYSWYWRSKDLDYAEVLGPDAHNILKTVDRVKLIYEDLGASVPVSLSVSVDGGTTWVTKTATIGTGDGTNKHYSFDFNNMDAVTGYFNTFKIESYSATLRSKILSMEVDFIPRGSYWTPPNAKAGT